ncbi:MAG: hypothetical protein JWO30_151 [Fibrobacteres bacterium]|nr:hypothetical protein [Fibrobacterota bacterium]
MSRFLKPASIGLAVALTCFGINARAHGDEDHHAAAPADTLTGEVVDLACYMAHDGKGKDHKQCAKQCIQKGLPVGLLTESGEIYLAVGENHKKANDMLLKDAANTITVVGKVSEKSGTKMITIHEVMKK